MYITFNKLRQSDKAICDKCEQRATWWSGDFSINTNTDLPKHFHCDKHAEINAKMCEEAQILVEWVDSENEFEDILCQECGHVHARCGMCEQTTQQTGGNHE